MKSSSTRVLKQTEQNAFDKLQVKYKFNIKFNIRNIKIYVKLTLSYKYLYDALDSKIRNYKFYMTILLIVIRTMMLPTRCVKSLY